MTKNHHIDSHQRDLHTIRRIYYSHDANPMLALSYTTARQSILDGLQRFRDDERLANETFYPVTASLLYGTTTEEESNE